MTPHPQWDGQHVRLAVFRAWGPTARRSWHLVPRGELFPHLGAGDAAVAVVSLAHERHGAGGWPGGTVLDIRPTKAIPSPHVARHADGQYRPPEWSHKGLAIIGCLGNMLRLPPRPVPLQYSLFDPDEET
jgi:hypothetical protein